MIPLRDSVRTRHFPLVNTLLMVINVAAFVVTVFLSEPDRVAFLGTFTLVPERFSPAYLAAYGYWPLATLWTSAFLHGSALHILGNMLYLWIFGDNIEDRLGRWGYLFFYLLSAALSGLIHVVASSGSRIPTLGASGAVAGVLGAYLVTYPRAAVLTLIPLGIFVPAVRIPAWVYLPVWFLIQVASGFATLRGAPPGVAWWAHVGGFGAGVVLIRLLPRHRWREPQRSF